jgi:excisionase family DNA binding protein
MAAEPELITIEEAAQYLRVCEKTLYRWLRDGKIRAYRAGRRWRFRRGDLDVWLLSQQHPHDGGQRPEGLLARLAELRARNRERVGREIADEQLERWVKDGKRRLVGGE